MSPWTILAWILLAALYAAVSVAFGLAGKTLGWPDWLAPAFSVGIVLLALLFALVKKLLAPSASAPPIAPGMQALTPAMAALMPPRELAKRWADFLPVIGKERLPVFLVLGEEDALRNKLWLSTPECLYLRDDASGLAFAAYPESLWVDVPASFLAPPPPAAGAPAASGGPPGLWEELVNFLPGLSGEVRGVLALVDSRRPAEESARMSVWLAGKLDILYAKYRKAPPVLWMAAARLEDFPGGGRLVEKLSASGDGGRALLSEALGALSPRRGARVGSGAFASCVSALKSGFGNFILACDSGGQDGGLSPESHLLRHALPAIGKNAEILCDTLARSGRVKKAPLGGVFLCGNGESGAGPAFGAALPRSVIPANSGRAASTGPNRRLYATAWLLLLAAALGLGALYRRAGDCIDAIPFQLLDASPNPGGFGGPPPVERYALARKELDKLEHSHRLAREVYDAPRRGLETAERLFAANLRSWLPDSGEPGAVDAWVEELCRWVEGRKGVNPLIFSTLAGRPLARMRGAHGRAGRSAAAGLLAEWRGLLDEQSRASVDHLLRKYDGNLYENWRREGFAVLGQTLAAAEADDFAVTTDFIASDPGFHFAIKAGEELHFGETAATDWAKAAMALAKVNRAASPNGAASRPIAAIIEAAKELEAAWRTDEPATAMDMASVAAGKLKDYRNSLAAIYPRCLDESALAGLAADAYSPPGGNPPPPSLRKTERAWTSCAASLASLEPVFAAGQGKDVLALAQSGYTLAFRAATVRAAKGVQAEWEETVLQPLSTVDGDEALVRMLEKNLLDVFVKASAKPFLALDDGRYIAAAALGQTFPFLDGALEWLNLANALMTKLDRQYPIGLTLLPVTVDQAAGLFPRGVRFTLDAGAEPVAVTGYNNKATASFAWSARTCLGAELAVLFDSFTVERKYPGAMGLVRFLQGMGTSGGISLPASEFPERRTELEQCGIDTITAHFEVSDPLRAAEVNASLPAPPKRLFPPLLHEGAPSRNSH